MAEYRKKLIEVALPLAEINDASAYDKMPGIGPHPKGIHHWWARLPLPTARAVLFASVVDDPSAHPERFPTEAAQNAERERLFDILRRLMQKRLHEHPEVYAEARAEMLKHAGGKLPPVLDPFAGGGSIPLEAARLGFEAHAADLNPVAVLLNKCNLELVPHWLDRPPVNPEARKNKLRSAEWRGARGVAEDVRYYARIARDRVVQKIGHLYPKVRLPKEYGGRDANVIAWLWARTVASPNPAAQGAQVPLVSSFWLNSPKKRKKPPYHWLEAVVDRKQGTWRFEVHGGEPYDRSTVRSGTKLGRGAFGCILTEQIAKDCVGRTRTPIEYSYLRDQAAEGKLGRRLLCIVAETKGGRVYVNEDSTHERLGGVEEATWRPDAPVTTPCHHVDRLPMYGMPTWADAFTPRQMTGMATLAELLKGIRVDVLRDAQGAGLGGECAEDYAAVVLTFLALALDRCADFNNALCTWSSPNQKVMHLFGRQAIPMVWDFAEANLLGDCVGAWSTCSDYVADCIEVLGKSAGKDGKGHLADAASSSTQVAGPLVSTDPPYYDNIGYAALSDFFYVWLRRTVGDLCPDLFKTILVPKEPELTAAPERFDGDREKAKEHFESGFRRTFTTLRQKMDSRFPLTVYYAFKQEDEEAGEDKGEKQDRGGRNAVDRTTGWETLLEALLGSGLQVTATWPVRASQKWRMVAMGTNALASYIVLACRPRPSEAPQCSRRELLGELKRELPSALRQLQRGSIAPVDLAQAAIGPGMAVFSRFSRVIEADGTPMGVRAALALINQTLDEVLSEQESEFDADTRWALAWFDQHAHADGPFGVAETLSKAKNVSVQGLVEGGMLASKAGKVRLLRRGELDPQWDPAAAKRLVWKVTQHLIRALESGGESGAAALLAKVGALGETARDLAYRLYMLCERKGWAQEALAYNGLVIAWPEIKKLAAGTAPLKQREAF